jgi:hypothetical protein
MQEFDGAAYYYRPDFNHRETPFKDIRDFTLECYPNQRGQAHLPDHELIRVEF